MAVEKKVRFMGMLPCCWTEVTDSGSVGPGTSHPVPLSAQGIMDIYWKVRDWAIAVTVDLAQLNDDSDPPCCSTSDKAEISIDSTIPSRGASEMRDLVCSDGSFSFTSDTGSSNSSVSFNMNLCDVYRYDGSYYPYIDFSASVDSSGPGTDTNGDGYYDNNDNSAGSCGTSITSIYDPTSPNNQVVGSVEINYGAGSITVPVAREISPDDECLPGIIFDAKISATGMY